MGGGPGGVMVEKIPLLYFDSLGPTLAFYAVVFARYHFF